MIAKQLQELEQKYRTLGQLETELLAEAESTKSARRKFIDDLFDNHFSDEDLFRAFSGDTKADVRRDTEGHGFMLCRSAVVQRKQGEVELRYYENDAVQAISMKGRAHFLLVRQKEAGQVTLYHHVFEGWFTNYNEDMKTYGSHELKEGLQVRYSNAFESIPNRPKFEIEEVDRDTLSEVGKYSKRSDQFSRFYDDLKLAASKAIAGNERQVKTFSGDLAYLQSQRRELEGVQDVAD